MKTNWALWGSLSGIIGPITFSILWISAVFVDGGWEFGKMTLSELGGERPGRCIFNTAVILAGSLMIPFAIGLYYNLPLGLASRIGGVMFLLSAFFLIAIGIFPITTGVPHTVASWSFFGLAIISLLIMIGPVLRSQVFGRTGMIATATVPIFSIALLVLTTVALAEAITVIMLMAWAIIMSIMMLINLRIGIVALK